MGAFGPDYWGLMTLISWCSSRWKYFSSLNSRNICWPILSSELTPADQSESSISWCNSFNYLLPSSVSLILSLPLSSDCVKCLKKRTDAAKQQPPTSQASAAEDTGKVFTSPPHSHSFTGTALTLTKVDFSSKFYHSGEKTKAGGGQEKHTNKKRCHQHPQLLRKSAKTLLKPY